jgi:hypothetical protein
MTSVSYIAQTMATGTHMANILIVGSALAGLYIRGQRHYFIDSVAVKSCGKGFEIVDCGDSSARQLIAETCSSDGVIINNCLSMAFSVIDTYNHPGSGVSMLGNNVSVVFTQCEFTSCGSKGVSIDGASEDIAITNCVMKFNASDGIYTGSNTSNISISNAVMCDNGGMGANMTGSGMKISNGCACSNGDIGVLLGGVDSSCTNVIVKDNTDGIRITANDCNASLNRCSGNSLEGLHIATGATDTIVTYNNLKGNTTNNLVNNGTSTVNAGNVGA